MLATGLGACSQELDHNETLVLFVIYFAGCMLNGRPVARGECISSRASGTPVTTSPAGE